MYFDVVAVVDPVTRDAQKLAPLLLVGSNHLVNLSAVGPRPHLISNRFSLPSLSSRRF